MTDQHGEAARTTAKTASTVISMFGGIRPMAKKMGIAVTTVQGWKERDVIPAARHEEVVRAAQRHGIALTMADLGGAGAEDADEPRSVSAWHRPASAAAPDDEVPEKTQPFPTVTDTAESVAAQAEPPVPSAEPEESAPEEEEEEPAAAAAPVAEKPRGGFGRALRRLAAVLVIGALVVGGGVYAWWQLAGGAGDPPWTRLAQSLGLAPEPVAPAAEVEQPAETAARQEPEAVPAAEELAGDVSGLRSRLDAAVAGLQDIETKLGAIEALEQRLAALEQSAGAPPGDVDAEAQAAALKSLEDRIAALEAGGGTDDTVAQLAQRLQALEARRAAGGAAVDRGDAQALTATLQRIEDRLAALEADGGDGEAAAQLAERVAALEARPDTSPSVETLEQRIAALEAQPDEPPAPPPGSREAALVLAVGQLREALRGAAPFAAELEAVRVLAGDDQEIAEALAPVATRADRGIATVAMLRDRFRPMAGAVVQSARLPEEPRWYDKALHKVTSLASVRRTGDVAGDDPEAIVARAELRLAKGDLDGAVEALGALQGRPAESVAGWLDDANARLAAETSLKSLQALAIARLRAAGPGAGDPAGDGTAPAGASGD